MAQTPEARIRLQYKAIRHSSFAHEHGTGPMWLSLAQQWKRPVQEIKRICHGPDWDPVADRERRLQARVKSEAQVAQVRVLMDEGRMDEARELFYGFYPELRRSGPMVPLVEGA